MHAWGDENVDWDGINDAAECIGMGLRTWGRVQVTQFKEKWGEVRVYCSLGLHGWNQLTHPGYVFNRWPRWLDFVTYPGPWNPFRWGLRVANWAVLPWHRWLYRAYYQWAVRRWPHLRHEILCCADWDELLEGL